MFGLPICKCTSDVRQQPASPPASWRITACLLACCTLGSLRAASIENPRLPQETAADQQAIVYVKSFEAKLEETRSLPPEARFRSSKKLKSDIERFLHRVSGTKHENKARYYLASWELEYGDLDAVEPQLTKIIRSPYLQYKNLAMHTRARLRLEQGRVPEARKDAETVVRKVPDYAPLLELIGFYEMAGSNAPRLSGKNLNGGPSEPLDSRNEPWMLVCFVEINKPEIAWEFQQLVTSITDEAFAGKLRPVIVSFDGNPLSAMTSINAMFRPKNDENFDSKNIDLLWVNPSNPLERGRWTSEWKLPALMASVLLGPDRSILAVNPRPNTLRSLVGLKPLRTTSPGLKGRKGLNWRGRRR